MIFQNFVLIYVHNRNYQPVGVIHRKLRIWIMFFQELSWIVAKVGIFASQEEYFSYMQKLVYLSTSIGISSSFFHSSCQSVEETKESHSTFDGEKPLESKIEECIIKEDIQCDLNQEIWFQSRIKSHQSFIVLYFLIALSKKLAFHALMYFNAYFSKLGMNIFLLLLHTWLHYK